MITPKCMAACVALAILVFGEAAPVRAQRTAVDSLASALESPDFNVRDQALRRITDSYSDPMPGQLVTAIIALLNREAAAIASHTGDEDYGEYVITLVVAGAHTNDSRAVDPLIKLGGLGVSGGVANFIASHGSSVFPALDAYALTGEMPAADVIEAYGLMLGRHGSVLSRADSGKIFAALMSVASGPASLSQDGVVYVASRIPLPEFLSVVEALAASNPRLLETPKAIAALTPLQASASPVTLLGRLQVALEGVCVGATGARNGACQSLQNQLATAIQHVVAGRTQPAKNVLAAFADRADAALQQQNLTNMEHHLFADTARQVAARF